MIYPRKITNILLKQISSKEIIVLTGMRRTGKTTVMKSIYGNIKSANKIFLDFENIIEQKLFEELDFNNIWNNFQKYGLEKSKKAYVFIDEIQNKPEAVKAIKYLYDHYNVKFFITGSSSFYLKNLFPESLSGRKILLEIYPLDFEEFLWFKNEKKHFEKELFQKDKNKNLFSYERYKKYFDEYLYFGGFPQVVLAKVQSQKKVYLNDIFNSFFEKDVRNLADFRNISIFRDMIFLLMQRTGSKLEISKIASELHTSRESVYSYLSFLEGSFFLYLISPFSRNTDKEVSGTRKIFFCDTGMLNHFARISEGSLFENSIFLNLKKYGKVNYFQKRSGSEIDFILPDKKIAIEVKTSGNIIDFKKLVRISKSIGFNKYYMLSKNFILEKGIIPATEI